MLAQATQLFAQIPASFWVLLGGIFAISGVQEFIKNAVENEDNKLSQSTNVLLLTALSSLASGVDYVTSASQADPNVLGTHTVLLVGATHLVYNFVLKPAISLVRDGLEHRRNQNATDAASAAAAAASRSAEAPV